MDFPIIVIWTSPLSILGESGAFFHFYFSFYRNSCKQTSVSSGSILFAYVPKIGRQAYMGKKDMHFDTLQVNLPSKIQNQQNVE